MSNPTWGNATRYESRPDPDAPNRFMSLAEALEARHISERHGTAFWVCRDAICLIFNENYAAYRQQNSPTCHGHSCDCDCECECHV